MTTRRCNNEDAPRALIHVIDPGTGVGPIQSRRMRDFNRLLADLERAIEEQRSGLLRDSAPNRVAEARQALRRFVRLIK
jgi:sugar-specific transcriptional regulator TrmB